MSSSYEISKDFKDRDLERHGAVALWGRMWKGEIIVRIKREHDEASDLLLDLLKARPDPKAGMDERAVEYYKALDAASRVSDRIRERMSRLASAAKTGRPRKGHEEAVDVTPMPAPEVAQPPGDGQPPL